MKKNKPEIEKPRPIKITETILDLSNEEISIFIDLAAAVDQDAGWNKSIMFDSLAVEWHYSGGCTIKGVRDEYEKETEARLERERKEKEEDLKELKRLSEKLNFTIAENNA